MFTTKAYTRLERKKSGWGGDNDDKFELNESVFLYRLLNRVYVCATVLTRTHTNTRECNLNATATTRRRIITVYITNFRK